MNLKYFMLRLSLAITISLIGFGTVSAQHNVQDTYIVMLSGVNQQQATFLTQQGIGAQKAGANKLIVSVTETQIAQLKALGASVEILKSSNPSKLRAPSQSGSLSNQYLILSVVDSGQFTLQTADGRYLLYPGGYTSYLSVNVDGQVYNNRDGSLNVTTGFTTVDANTAYVQYLTPENILITQRYTLSGQAVQLQVQASNQSTTPHAISVRYLLDTQVDVDDGSPLYAPNVGVRTYETDLPLPSFNSWQAYDIWPNPTLTAIGTFSTQPNRVVFAWWPNAVGHTWDYTPDPNQAFYTPGYTYSPYSDSCVLLYFDMGVLAANSQASITTNYGTGAPTGASKRDQLISAFYQFKEAVKSSITADVDAFASLQAKYYVSLRPNWKDYVQAVWTFSEPSPSKISKLGKDAQLIEQLTSVVGKVGIANTFFNQLGSIATTGIPDSASETDVKNTYIYSPLMNTVSFSPKNGGGTYTGISSYLSAIDNDYQSYVNAIPNPLPANYPTDSIIQFLNEQTAALNTSNSQETFVPVYWQNSCTLAKLGVLQFQKGNMASQASNLEVANNVSWVTTLTGISAVLGGAGLKIAGVVGEPVTLGGSTVVLIPSEAVLWGGVADILFISDTIGAGSGIAGLSIQGAMSGVSIEATWQLANDLEYRRAIFNSTASWIESPTLSPARQIRRPMNLGAIQVSSVSVPNLTVAQNQTIGQGNGQVQVTNNGSSALNVTVEGSITAELNNGMPIVGLVGSSIISVAPGEQKNISFVYSLIRSSLVDHAGYDVHLFVTAANSGGISDILGPFVAHFYVGTSSQLAVLSGQTQTTLNHGTLDAGQITGTVQFAVGIQSARLMLSFAEGSDYDLHLYDANGNHVGVNYNTGQVEVQIPGAQYSGATSWPEWITLANPTTGTYQYEIVARSPAAGNGYDLSKVETPALPALLDVPAQISVNLNRSSRTATVTDSFAAQIAEAGGSQNISNLQMAVSNFVGNTTIPASQVSCTPPSSVAAGQSALGNCSVTISPQVPVGDYIGTIQVNGKDNGGNTLSATTQVTISLVQSGSSLYLPLIQR